jgi:selenide,water dikinase
VERARISADLVLVGGGHAHVQVLRRFAMAPLPGVRLTLLLDRPEAVYSGMVPGFVAGEVRAHELEIDLVPLARRAGARIVLAPALGIDTTARRVEIESRPPLRYDVASLDVGSTLRGLELPGVREHALATRPIRDFVDRVEARLEACSARTSTPRVAVVGGGAAGIELAFTLEARLCRSGRRAVVTLLEAAPRLLSGMPAGAARRLLREAARRGIALRSAARVTRVDAEGLWLEDAREAADLVVWAAGAAPWPWLARAAIPLDAAGFLRVRATLQVVGQDDLFAVGDCASLDDTPWVPKAGVYAVREGPVLEANLRARLGGGRLRAYRPQRDFLALLNLGDGRALGSKWRLSASGRAVWRLKDRIDRSFVRRFQVLEADGTPTREFPPMEGEPMECGGCAAKVGATSLAATLSRLPPAPLDASVLLGLERPDDAAALRTASDDVVLSSVDAFRAFSDDPWLVGRVAAVNAASDLFAMGGRPRHAQALVTVPEAESERAEETLFQVLSGVRAGLDPLGISLVGGHSTRGSQLGVGIAISGEPDGPLLRKQGLRAGEVLVLSKPLGTGVVLAADMQGRASGRALQAAIASMLRPNADAARSARDAGARACTDVSGFGLAVHLGEMLRASGVGARIDLAALPALPCAVDLLSSGLRSTFHAQNQLASASLAWAPDCAGDPRAALLFDPQTSGGLLFGATPERALEAVSALRAGGDGDAAVIGEVVPARGDGVLVEVVRSRSATATSPQSSP